MPVAMPTWRKVELTPLAIPARSTGTTPTAVDGLTAALSGGQVQAAATGAQQAATAAQGPTVGQQAHDLVQQVGTSGVVDALNHITLIAAVVAFTSAVLTLILIRQKDFVVRGGPPAVEVAGAGDDDETPGSRAEGAHHA